MSDKNKTSDKTILNADIQDSIQAHVEPELQKMIEQILAAPQENMDYAEQVKQQIASGEFVIDYELLSEKLLEIETELATKQSSAKKKLPV